MVFSCFFYKLGLHDKAITVGESDLEMNRQFPQAHKYVALSQKAKGDHALAIKTMKNAVLYEAPWDESNLELNKDLLQEITIWKNF